MSGCQRCLECGCLAVSDVLCADVWLSAMSHQHGGNNWIDMRWEQTNKVERHCTRRYKTGHDVQSRMLGS